MATFLFDKIIFGPVRSRRLGLSLGVNLLHPASKHCNFDCVYCECGWNAEHPRGGFNSLQAVARALEAKLIEMGEQGELPAYITFAGNGEPTMHPKFAEVIDQTIELRDRLAPEAKIAVLSNATMIDRPTVVEALRRVDRAILKLDSGLDATVRTVNRPNNPRTAAETVRLLKEFGGALVVQTMLLRGEYGGVRFDNTTEEELAALEEALLAIGPREVMLYSTDRDTPAAGVERVEKAELERVAERFRSKGLTVTVS